MVAIRTSSLRVILWRGTSCPFARDYSCTISHSACQYTGLILVSTCLNLATSTRGKHVYRVSESAKKHFGCRVLGA